LPTPATMPAIATMRADIILGIWLIPPSICSIGTKRVIHLGHMGLIVD
jgi:hypothetical protein